MMKTVIILGLILASLIVSLFFPAQMSTEAISYTGLDGVIIHQTYYNILQGICILFGFFAIVNFILFIVGFPCGGGRYGGM